MNVLIVGAGKGSYTMRAVQVGQALGARVTSGPTAHDWRWADVAILVKRCAPMYAGAARAAGVPVVWDALDFWQQPAQNGLDEAGAHSLLREWLRTVAPSMVIGATSAMTAVCEASGVRAVTIPHHSWHDLTPTPPRREMRVIAYQGAPQFLGAWARTLMDLCAARGWTFLINPSDLRVADVLVSLRDGPWDGFMCRQWKSGVKAVNAVAAGRPLISQGAVGVIDCAAPWTHLTVETPAELERACDVWADQAHRVLAYEAACALAPQFTLSHIRQQYTALLQTVLEGVLCLS